MEPFTLQTNSASQEHLLHLLRECDSQFIPHLSQRVDLDSYAAKLFNHAQLFEAWQGSECVGVVATYLNNTSSRCGFISNVCVMPSHVGKGLASKLLELCKQKTIEAGFAALELEVYAGNLPAIKLYEKNGFVHTNQADGFCVMRCAL